MKFRRDVAEKVEAPEPRDLLADHALVGLLISVHGFEEGDLLTRRPERQPKLTALALQAFPAFGHNFIAGRWRWSGGER
jgi:hypothetical protein